LWENPAEDDIYIAWPRDFVEAVGPYIALDSSPNFTSD
jgi:hypothetical protein